MERGQPSRTALAAAGHRAAHQVLEQGAIFLDPLARKILGEHAAAAALREAEDNPGKRRLRLFLAVRSRFAEDALAAALKNGLQQVAILGAGLDTYAYRAILAPGVKVFEVDHPATQAWKREMLSAAGIPVPESLTFAPVDFERETLKQGLLDAGFDFGRPEFFPWLGVVPYLSEEAIFVTLRMIAELPTGSQVVFDYANPALADPAAGGYAAFDEALRTKVAALGEAIRSYFETEDLHERLLTLGFRHIEDLGPEAIRQRYFGGRGSSTSNRGGHVLRAAVER